MNLKNTYRKGFTLIELLVVISIIGMLSSIVLASLNSAREKARLAAAKAFAASLHNRLGAYPVALYDFNEGVNNLVDLSSNTSGTVLQGTGNSWVAGIEGQAIDLPGNNNNYALVTLPTSRPQQATYSIWFNPDTLSGDMAMASFLAAYDGNGADPNSSVHVRGRMYLNSSGQPVFLTMSYSAAPQGYVAVTGSTAAKVGVWNHLAVSVDYSNGMDTKMYLNGQLVGTGNFGQNRNNEFVYAWIGRKKAVEASFTSWDGKLDAFRLYEGLVQ